MQEPTFTKELMTPKHIGITGTQKGMTLQQAVQVDGLLQDFQNLGVRAFHHGDCIGADEQGRASAVRHGYRIFQHPPTDSKKRAFCPDEEVFTPRPYLERNRSIVNCVDVLIATPSGYSEQVRSGTWATVRYARKLGRSVILVMPNGYLATEGGELR